MLVAMNRSLSLVMLATALGAALPAFADDATGGVDPNVAAPPPAAAPMPPPPRAEAPHAARAHTLGVGYKLGDGIGFEGADVIISPAPHIVVDLFGSIFPVDSVSATGTTTTTNGYAFAPGVQYHLRDEGASTPYAAVGLQYAHLTLDGVSASAAGFYANLGYEWKWSWGLGVQLGGGLQYLQKGEATSGTTTLTFGGSVKPNLEFGLRYMFL
jgi:hypothetical protein